MQYRREIGFAFVVADRAIVFDELRDMRLVKSGVVAGEQNGPAGGPDLTTFREGLALLAWDVGPVLNSSRVTHLRPKRNCADHGSDAV